MSTDSTSLAQSLVDAAAEEARAVFFATVVGYIGTVDGHQHTFAPEEIQLVIGDAPPSLWVRITESVLDVLHREHTAGLMPYNPGAYLNELIEKVREVS